MIKLLRTTLKSNNKPCIKNQLTYLVAASK